MSKVREVINSEDVEKIRQETEALFSVVQQVGTAAYQQEAPSEQAPSEDEQGDEPDSGPDDEEVVDGEFRNV